MKDSASALIVLCTVPNPDVGAELSRSIIERKLAACVNVVPGVRSVYEWQGKIEEEEEAQLIIKTIPQRFEELASFLSEAHPYDEPEVLALPVTQGSATYLAWVHARTT